MADRPHGTRTKYAHDKCRCRACTDANREYENDRARNTTPAYVGADRARRHLRYLATNGVGYKTAARVAGLSTSAISTILYGQPSLGRPVKKRIRLSTEQAILAVTPHDAAPGAYVPATGVPEIIDTLLKRGWTRVGIARQLHPDTNTRSLQLGTTKITVTNLRKLTALLDQPAPERVTSWAHRYYEPPEDDDQADRDQSAERQRAYRAKTADPDTPIRDPYRLPTLHDTTIDRTWMTDATCRRPEYPTWMFFPGRGDTRTLAKAREVCARCPVNTACLDYANQIGAHDGVWAGTSERERRTLRRTIRVA